MHQGDPLEEALCEEGTEIKAEMEKTSEFSYCGLFVGIL